MWCLSVKFYLDFGRIYEVALIPLVYQHNQSLTVIKFFLKQNLFLLITKYNTLNLKRPDIGFPCSNGNCESLNATCDGIYDCRDIYDES